MRVKIKKLLKGGKYLLFFETLDFNPDEKEKIKKFGIPVVDLSSEGLGRHKLDQLAFTLKCQSQEEAEQKISSIKRNIKNKLTQLSSQVDDLYVEKVVQISRKRKLLVLGFLCAFALMIFSAYKGVISSQPSAGREKQAFAPVPAHAIRDDMTNEGNAASSEDTEASGNDPMANCEVEHSEHVTAHAYAKGSATLVKPDFILTAVPDTLIRYSDWESNIAGSADKANFNHFKLVLTPLGGFRGPVTLGVWGIPSIVKTRLSPEKIEQLPGSSTLLISLPTQTLPQICPRITIIARGKIPQGDLITHQKELVLTIRQKSSYQGPTWYISTNGNDQSGDGGWGSPFRTIQRGIDCAKAGDTVLVERGLYKENINLIYKDSILVASCYIFDQSQSTMSSTIIEAKKSGWVVTIGRSNQVTLRGFTIQEGMGDNGSYGGGIYCYNSSLKILDNIITRNENRYGYGAGVFCYDSDFNIWNNHITYNYNYDGHGAGIYCYKSTSDIQHNIISGNYSSGGGSGIHLLNPNSVKIIRNVIHSDSGSAAVVLYTNAIGITGDFQVINNTISHNQGDGIRYFGGPWSFQNNIITHNHGYGLFTLEGIAHLSHNNVWSNVSSNDTMNYYGLSDNLSGNNGNISKNPCFGNPSHGNFHLCFNSPCINSGNPNGPVPSGGGLHVDMGALEYTHPNIICGDMNRDGFLDYGDINYLVNLLSGKVISPIPLQIADVNCDDEIDQQDLSYLYKFLYYYGSEPCANCKSKDRLTEKE